MHPASPPRRRAVLTCLLAAPAAALAAPPQRQATKAPKAAKAPRAAKKNPTRHAAPASAPAAEGSATYAAHPGALAFAAEVGARRALDSGWIAGALAQAQRIETVRRLIMPPPPGAAKNWAAYRARFVEPQRIAGGVEFWRRHAAWLDLAEQRWGVPPEIVVAIVGVETYYGRVTGNFRLVDALATLAFDFPPGRKDRSDFFRGELEEFFVLCAREQADPQALRGSYAGAVGLPQFMPGSINRWAVDLDGDGHIDLLNSPADVCGSVAHYLAAFGWQRGLATHYGVAVPVDTAERARLLAPDILPTFTAAQFAEHGALLDGPGRAHEGKLALVELQNGDRAASYVAGTSNFYAITRYNWSSYYAMSVIDLAAAVRQARVG